MATADSDRQMSADAQCSSCDGTGLYRGLAERDGTAVVCSKCHGTGRVTVTWVPFQGRQPAPATVKRVHVARGYVLSTKHPGCQGGVPIADWTPGTVVPADEQLYCPYLYTNQAWCALPRVAGKRSNAPLLPGDEIASCRYWDAKAACWALFHAADDAPTVTE